MTIWTQIKLYYGLEDKFPYKQAKYVNTIFNILKSRLGDDEFKRLFEVILTDNGTEFSDPESIEINPETGEKLCSLFYCDPNCSWQKGSIEKNHEFIRYSLPKGTSFASLTQEDCYLIASHINSVPRDKFKGLSAFKVQQVIVPDEFFKKLNYKEIYKLDVNLKSNLLKKDTIR